jgi:hypothetical protein
MRHEREFEVAEPYVEPLSNLVLSIFWGSAGMFCIAFWWGLIRLILSH